jgi:hypothetical protein
MYFVYSLIPLFFVFFFLFFFTVYFVYYLIPLFLYFFPFSFSFSFFLFFLFFFSFGFFYQGHKGVLLYHDRSVTKALLDLFPNIGLEKDKIPIPSISSTLSPSLSLVDLLPHLSFPHLSSPYLLTKFKDKFRKTKVLLKFFEDYAKALKFDPLFANSSRLSSFPVSCSQILWTN